jgi:hypothetical protein
VPETVQIVEFKQPFCALTFGSSPCTATGGADVKCYNTRSTCLDTANFDGSTLSLFFSTGRVAERGVSGAPYILPLLKSVSTSPTQINLAGSSSDAKGLGIQSLCTITFRDAPHTDRRVDPYVDGRSWDPLDAGRGTFWTRWVARNKYRQNMQIVVYDGYEGQALSEMIKRTYFLQEFNGPGSGGGVSIKCKGILAKAEERKAQAPLASPGVLYNNITAGATSLEAATAVEADYPSSGWLRINDEIMQYTSRATSTNGVTFSGLSRGAFNTSAAAHSFDDAVQETLVYQNEPADTIVADLLENYAGIDASWLDTTNWAAEFDTYSAFYNLTTVISEPESVIDLLAQISVQVGFYLWWDEREALIKWKAIRGIDAVPPLITDDLNILAGSFSITEMPRQRVSQVWVYYNRFKWTASIDDAASYREQYILANIEAEGDDLYGERSIRKIFARWLPTGALAQNTASKILTRYVDTPSSCTFDLDAKDRALWVGDTIRISHYRDVLPSGERHIRNWTITSAQEVKPGQVARYTAEDTTLYGEIKRIQAAGAADYNPAGGNPEFAAYIGDADGLLSDGTQAARIA